MTRFLFFIFTIGFSFIINDKKTTHITQNATVDDNSGDSTKVDSTKSEVKKIGNTHSATWYNMHGHKTASGQKFHKDSLTAAYNFSPLGSYLRVTNLSSGLVVVVKVNDRMGNKTKDHIDLSKCAFDSIANPSSGRIKVSVEQIIRK